MPADIIKCFDYCKLDPSKGDFLNELGAELASNLSLSLVSVVSFNGETRQFACSGIFIEFDLGVSILTSASLVRSADDENKIDHKLQDGIGGPIIDFNGNFIGMNFDDKGKTSFLPGDVILGLTHLKSRGLMIVDDLSERNQTRSPVHEPYWLDASIDEPADPLLELALRPMELI
ncbi:hypothetical protein EJB05_44400 [Eragrostis curvula]|uniref:Uncharacterized protein n=1 Tax=Eragrostis curvula TaxID=38414 RepID=A0A5J9THZ5_9POAL|nr:hypothetical protein EJB05_44400 [Eragrostis curvula]